MEIWTGVTDAWLTDWLTDWQTLKDRATQLLIKYKSGALVTQWTERPFSNYGCWMRTIEAECFTICATYLKNVWVWATLAWSKNNCKQMDMSCNRKGKNIWIYMHHIALVSNHSTFHNGFCFFVDGKIGMVIWWSAAPGQGRHCIVLVTSIVFLHGWNIFGYSLFGYLSN